MVRADLRLTRAHDAWARRRLLAAVAEARARHPDPAALDSLRTLALALGEEGIAAWADAGEVGRPVDLGDSGSGGPPMPPAETILRARVAAGIPSAAPEGGEAAESPPVRLRPAPASRVPRARHAWIASVLRAAALEPVEGDGVVITRRPGTAAAAAWLERLSAHPEIEASR